MNIAGIANVRCNGTESSFSQCEKEDGNVTCESGMYASALCTDTTPPVEGMQNLNMNIQFT